jgi:tetratricopeptide (TPR) repeat protein
MGKEESDGTLLAADVVKLQAALHQRRFLLVLDGLERVLRGYSGMDAMFTREKGFQGRAGTEAQWEKRQREPVHPLAAKFLPHLASYAGKTKTLITTRLMPLCLEGLAGMKPVKLEGLSQGDAVRFLRSEGVKGTRAELEQAGKVYGFHPLMLKLLVSAIKRSRSKDVQEAFGLNIIDEKEPQKILTTAFNLLSKEESQVAAAISVFRSVFTFGAARALFPKLKEDRLWHVMLDLQSLGFLLVDEKENRFDFHPIMRSFLYHSLTNRAEVHLLAIQYFQALPKEEKIISLEDLAPVIELYHHLVKAGKFDDALYIFDKRLHNPCYYQLSAYYLIIELLKELFPDGEGEDRLPRLAKEPAQAWTLNSLANTYAISGQPARSVHLYLLQIKLYEKNDGKKALAISLGNIAQTAQFHIGQLSASTAHLRKSIALRREIEDEFEEAVGHQELGRVLAFQGRVKRVKSNSPCAEEELAKSTTYWEKTQNYQRLSINSAYRSLSDLLQVRLAAVLSGEKNHAAGHTREAVAQARKALEFAEKTAKKQFPYPRDFVWAYWLLGESLVQCRLGPGPGQVKPFEIPFYDEHFQHRVGSVKTDKSSQWAAAERCLTEALRRCRKVNLVESEPDILLARAQLEWAKISSLPGNRRCDSLPAVETTLKDALEIAQRAGYRLKLADLHLFCGQVLRQLKEETTLLGLNAHDHLQKTKDYALDVSEFSHLYQSLNPDFYKGIPEYQMLKRGMTKEERIRNGYWVAYRIAEQLSAAV